MAIKVRDYEVRLTRNKDERRQVRQLRYDVLSKKRAHLPPMNKKIYAKNMMIMTAMRNIWRFFIMEKLLVHIALLTEIMPKRWVAFIRNLNLI